MKQNLLLIEDVEDLGKKGEIVNVKAGYGRNFLVPQGKAVPATKHTLRMQEKLQEEREKQAEIDRLEAEALAKKIEGITLAVSVKVDPEGRMYGSVSQTDIADLFKKQNLDVDKKFVQVKKPIKETGVHEITLRMKENVTANFYLKIVPEGKEELAIAEQVAKEAVEAQHEEQKEILE